MGEKNRPTPRRNGRPKKEGAYAHSGRSKDGWHPWWVWQLLRRNRFYIEAVEKFEHTIATGDAPTLKMIYADIKRHCDLATTDDFRTLKRGYVGLDTLKIINEQAVGNVTNPQGADFPKIHHFQQLLNRIGDHSQLTELERTALSDFNAVYGDVIAFPISPTLENLQTGLFHTAFHFRPAFSVEDESMPKHIASLKINLRFSDDFILKEVKKILLIQRGFRPDLRGLDGITSKKWDELDVQIAAFDHKVSGRDTAQIRDLLKEQFQSNFSNAFAQIPKWIEQVQDLIGVFDPNTTNVDAAD